MGRNCITLRKSEIDGGSMLSYGRASCHRRKYNRKSLGNSLGADQRPVEKLCVL